MNNIFDSKTIYAGNWSVSASRKFNADEIDSVLRAEVVNSDYGKSVCFYMKTGGQAYIPLSRDSQASVGQSVKLEDCTLLTLSRPGDADIDRVEI